GTNSGSSDRRYRRLLIAMSPSNFGRSRSSDAPASTAATPTGASGLTSGRRGALGGGMLGPPSPCGKRVASLARGRSSIAGVGGRTDGFDGRRSAFARSGGVGGEVCGRGAGDGPASVAAFFASAELPSGATTGASAGDGPASVAAFFASAELPS